MWYVTNEWFLIVNDDNVFPKDWDKRMMSDLEYAKNFKFGDKFVMTPRQIEPTGPSIFNFDIKDFGRDAKTFDYDGYCQYEKTILDDSYNRFSKLWRDISIRDEEKILHGSWWF